MPLPDGCGPVSGKGWIRVLALGHALASLAAAQVTLRYDPSGVVEARGLQAPAGEPPEQTLRVYFGAADTPMLGEYTFTGGVLRFRPRYPFLGGQEHRAVSGSVELRFTPESEPAAPAARVTGISPALAVVPANLLRLYVHFSRPMRRAGIGRHIRLETAGGQPVEAAFLEMDDGLWDPGGRRLTVFFHPGRIKRGLALGNRLGLPLRAGERYRLVVAADARDEEGQPLEAAFRHEFAAGPPDRESPDPSSWRIEPPPGGSRAPLVVTSPEPLDEALFARLVTVADVAGSARVDPDLRVWRFTPAVPWAPGEYRLEIAAELEDLAGNRPGRRFDEPAAADGSRREARAATRAFRIR